MEVLWTVPFNIGAMELIIVLVVVLIIFGVGKLPEIGGAMGKAIREFRSSQHSEKKPTQDSQSTSETTNEQK